MAVSPLAHAAGKTAAPTPGYRPLVTTDEAGLWAQSDEAEITVRQSPALVSDETLNAYVRDLVCKLAGDRCGSMRVYVMDVPLVNAYCSPNGMMVVWTGLLLRTENEAQLAFLLGHEMTHYLNRHGLKGYRTNRDMQNGLAFLTLGLAGVSAGMGIPLGGATTLARTIAYGAYFSYSREQETEADAGGFALAVTQGFDPRQGAVIWRNIEAEEAANPKRRYRPAFYADHPSNKARMAAMEKRAAEMMPTVQGGILGTQSYRDAVLSHRGEWLQEEIDRGQYAESIFTISRLLKADPDSGELHFFLGEAHRRRNGAGDTQSAISAYEAALASPDAPAAAYRGLGLVAFKRGKIGAEMARDAFQHYLARAPEAKDRATVAYYLTILGAAKP